MKVLELIVNAVAALQKKFGRKIIVRFEGTTTDGCRLESTAELRGFGKTVSEEQKEQVILRLEQFIKKRTGKTVETIHIISIECKR